ncbi:hypothetical protein KR018_011229 [Drosophila ironensis]|nr:hypothetical protein KR018_011229 [Drosophila ironensis]
MTPDLPFDFFTMHYPCSLDIYIHPPVKDVGSYYHWLPPHCVIIYNNRFAHEGYYRVYNLYRMEGFTFGMYYERIKRYETEAYVFDYTNIRLE